MKPHCDRCRTEAQITIMSRFNTDTICMPCASDEREAPGYNAASAAESAAVRAGDYKFPGVGLSAEDRIFLAGRRKARGAA